MTLIGILYTIPCPTNWEFSICFPDCHNVGVINGSDLLLPNVKSYLNCHMYPNGTFGEGVVKMEILTNNIYRDYYGMVEVNLSSNIENQNSSDQYKLTKVTDIYGRETSKHNNKLLIYICNVERLKKKFNLK